MPKSLNSWATKWGLPRAALEELIDVLESPGGSGSGGSTGDEARVQSEVCLEASRKGCRLWRNNNGAFKNANGRLVRFGLGNTSKRINQAFKSSDLIGIRPLTVTPDLIGSTVGIFLAREVKSSNWVFNPSCQRESAQLRFLEIINSLGGDAAFATGEGSI